MKKLIFIILTLSLFLPSCVYAVRYDGEYSGRVIDTDTGEPIEGVVVLGVWYTEYYGAGGAVHKFYDAKETVTDKNGDFSISGQGIEVMSNVTPMDVVIFRAGYENIGKGPWSSFKNDKLLKEKIKCEGRKAVIPLKKWTMEERRNRWRNIYGSPYVNVPDEKQQLLLKEIEKEKSEIGK